MSRYDTGTDDPRVKVRPGKGTRPRSKQRPDYSASPSGRVVAIDRGRYLVAIGETMVSCVKARELGRGGVVIGDLVNVTGDVSGTEGTLGRIVQISERQHVLRRSLEEAPEGRGEKIIVANADLMVIVAAVADPEPRIGMIDRCLVAAKEAGIDAILCLTKTDLASPAEVMRSYQDFPLKVVTTSVTKNDEGLMELKAELADKFSVLVGHSGVGKSTLINALVPDANRSVGHVSLLTGKGRHTSTSAVAFALPEGGWVVDTPGVRSFGLSHVTTDDILEAFPGIAAVTELCLPNCSHLDSDPSCALNRWIETAVDQPQHEDRKTLVNRMRRILSRSLTQ